MKTEPVFKALEPVAQEILSNFAIITELANTELRSLSSARADVFANTSNSTFTTADSASVTLSEGNRTVRVNDELLKREPAIARVETSDGENDYVSYICRATPPANTTLDLVSQRAPKGRLASLPIGESLTLPNGKTLTVLSRTELHPEATSNQWDSRNTVFRGEHDRPLTIESLLAFLSKSGTEVEIDDLLGKLLDDESRKDLIREGSKRSILTSMQLRDQAILDSHQDEIFRLPLSDQIFLSGPPGTGKTTTLIRRLGQKLDSVYLSDDERKQVARADASGSVAHADSWLMFTPTELLRQYVKEAFSRERIPASDLRIKTWDEYRRETARNVLRILRSASKRSFVLKVEAQTTDAAASEDQRSFFDDFDTWQRQQFLNVLSVSANALRESQVVAAAHVGSSISKFISRSSIHSLADLFIAISRQESDLRALVEELRASVDAPLRRALNRRLNKDKSFIATLNDTLQRSGLLDEADLDDGTEEDDEEDDSPSGSGLTLAVNAYMAALRALARARFSGRKVTQDTRNGRVLSLVGEDDLDVDHLKAIGKSLTILLHARRLLTPARRFVFGAPKRYRAYRRIRQREGQWFYREASLGEEVNELELDVLFLATLRAGRDLLGRGEIRENVDDRVWAHLQPILDLYRNQILVDEATDFSSIQLACMVALVHPNTKSFFASGDFNQRLTTYGVSSADDLIWVSSALKLKEITVLFRQSHKLQALTQSILATFQTNDSIGQTAADMEGNEASPVLKEHHGSVEDIARWLAERIREIEGSLGQLPSIAVFVTSEEQVEPLAAALNSELAGDNLQAVACLRGRVKGQENDIRVFDVQHVKGLEFEAVFFIGVDQLAQKMPLVFARYLYVGATRAATYLGLSCQTVLPQSFRHLTNSFAANWRYDGVGPTA